MKNAAYKVLANRQDITAKISDRLIRLSLHDAAGFENDTAEIELDNRDSAIEVPPTGAELDIYIGYEDELSYRGTYTVDEIEEPLDVDVLILKAQAAKMKNSLKAPRDDSYDNVTLGELASQIAARHGYQPAVADSMASITLTHIDQRGESDMNLLTRLAKENNGLFKMAANRLVILPKEAGKSVSGKELPRVTISDPENSTGSVTIKDKDDYQSVVAYWFDEPNQEKVAETIGGGEPQFVIKKTHSDQQAAINAATAKLGELKRGNGSLSITRPLSPEIMPEGFLVLENHKQSANGEWLVESVDHVIEPGRAATTSASCAIKDS
ncbi:contractile injection system protein, VgrG/Pvc8 family [Vibrio parahaemolyticus]